MNPLNSTNSTFSEYTNIKSRGNSSKAIPEFPNKSLDLSRVGTDEDDILKHFEENNHIITKNVQNLWFNSLDLMSLDNEQILNNLIARIRVISDIAVQK